MTDEKENGKSIELYATRDKSSSRPELWVNKPINDGGLWRPSGHGFAGMLCVGTNFLRDYFADLTYENSPRKITISMEESV